MSRGMTIERIMEFFREVDLDVARVALSVVTTIVQDRKRGKRMAQAKQAIAAARAPKARNTTKLLDKLSTAEASHETLADA